MQYLMLYRMRYQVRELNIQWPFRCASDCYVFMQYRMRYRMRYHIVLYLQYIACYITVRYCSAIFLGLYSKRYRMQYRIRYRNAMSFYDIVCYIACDILKISHYAILQQNIACDILKISHAISHNMISSRYRMRYSIRYRRMMSHCNIVSDIL